MKIDKMHIMRRKSSGIMLLVIIVAVVAGVVIKTDMIQAKGVNATHLTPKKTVSPVAKSMSLPKPAPVPPPLPPEFNKETYSTTDPSSLWFVANKKHPLPADYIPSDLITGASGYTYSAKVDADLRAMLQAAASQNIHLEINSAYRSYTTQVSLYNSYVAQYGQASADTFSARPAFSEHQTGLALDINDSLNTACQFADCSEGINGATWLAMHANEYGFIIRYTKQNTATTGYEPEPWHVRYVGHALASELQKDGVTSLEDFFGIAGGDYM